MYLAGWHSPGETPDTDPEEFATFNEARRYILETMLLHQDSIADQDEAGALLLAQKQQDVAEFEVPFQTDECAGLIYWVEDIYG